MTEQELSKVPFRCVGHLSLENEHMLTYKSPDGRLGFCMHTPKLKDGSFGQGRTHYKIDGKVYKSKKKFLEALAKFKPTLKTFNK